MDATRDTTQSCSGGQAALAASLASRLADDNADSNLVLSPLSIYAALALLAAGARGATLDEILGVLGAPSRAALDEFLSRVAEDALKDHSESGGPRVAFAYGVWTDLACPLKPAYRHAAVSTYKADASTVDFRNNPEAARSQINAWVAQVTSNLIRSVLRPGSITPLTRVVLGNAIYFKGKWEKPFDKEDTANKPFHRLDGRTVDVPFMKSWSSQYIAVHDGFKVLKLRYRMAQAQGNPFVHSQSRSFHSRFLHKHLPKEKIDVRKFRVPKFKLSFHNSLVTVLKKLGLQLPFSDQADLSDMVEMPFVLSDVIHKAVIEVNEEGTEAAASTLMHIGAGCCAMPPSPPPPVDFVADHPFAYFIVEEATGIVVFAGHVVDPSNKD
ncbi:hypothetical protein CFC21_073625 [Triticum aestivum]|uniref:Serpin domain-containing protein n=2 Tax=Triticum aestivum TaxID=4565 RepID=A0A3B6LTJ8_WHEAT|nr:hypothetical protein CFC21_073625 [Triticum aestivum]